MHQHFVPLIVVEPDFAWFHSLFESGRAQFDGEHDAAVPEGQAHEVTLAVARVQQQTVRLPRLKEQRYLIARAQYGFSAS